jgi:hypothetical protein
MYDESSPPSLTLKLNNNKENNMVKPNAIIKYSAFSIKEVLD